MSLSTGGSRRHGKSSFQTIGDINLTPMLDFAFLLLTVFLITYPLMEQGIHVSLPMGKADDLKQPDKNRTITLNVQGSVYLDSKIVTINQLTDEMRRAGRFDPKVTVYIRADKDIKYGKLAEVMKVLHDARISRMALVTQAE